MWEHINAVCPCNAFSKWVNRHHSLCKYFKSKNPRVSFNSHTASTKLADTKADTKNFTATIMFSEFENEFMAHLNCMQNTHQSKYANEVNLLRKNISKI